MTLAADGIDPGFDAQVIEAQKAGGPTLVLFGANWCPACRMMHAEFGRADVAAELDHYSLVFVDLTHPTPAAQQHARQYGAEYIPLLVRFDADGKETGRTNSLPPAELVQFLKDGE